MADPTNKPRRTRSHWEGRIARAVTPPAGTPVHVDPELTPPPIEPPKPRTITGYESIPPEVQAQLDTLRDSIAEATTAIARVWDVRNVGSQIERLETKVDGYTKDAIESAAQLRQFVLPSLKHQMAKLQELSAYHERNVGRSERLWREELPAMKRSLEQLDERFDRLDGRLARIEQGLEGLQSLAHRVVDIDKRLSIVERRHADDDAGDRRQLQLAHKRRRFLKFAIYAIGTLGGAAAAWLGFS